MEQQQNPNNCSTTQPTPTPQKQKICSLISKDNINALAPLLNQLGNLSENSGLQSHQQILDTDMKWMMIHLCCRWDASSCLDYLLKLYFCYHANRYVDFVNAGTADGLTCLHLCAQWRSQKSFYVLIYYGGIHLKAQDNFGKTPEDVSAQYKMHRIKDVLKGYSDIKIGFKSIEPERFLDGKIIPDDITTDQRKKKKAVEEDRQKMLKQQELIKKQQPSETKQLEAQKVKLEKDIERILKEKLKLENASESQKKKTISELKRKGKTMDAQQLAECQSQSLSQIQQKLKAALQQILENLHKNQTRISEIKQFLKQQEETQNKQRQAKTYAKLQIYSQAESTKEIIKSKLVELHEKIGKLREQEEEKAKKEFEQNQRKKKKIQEEYARKQEKLNLLLKQKEQEMERIRIKEEERIRKEKQKTDKLAEDILKKAHADYLKQVKLMEQQMRRIRDLQSLRLKRQKEQAQKQQSQSLQHRRSTQQTQSTTPSLSQQFSKLPQQVPEQLLQLYKDAIIIGAFTDKEFPASNKSIGPSSHPEYDRLTRNTVWLRAKQLFNGQFQLFDGIDPNDIKQGSLGVCYLLATISALAKNPINIRNIFLFADLKIGFYLLKLYISGKPKFIVVDDLIPCNRTMRYPLFSKPIGKEVWVLLIEKAWAKMNGDYLSSESMPPDQIMEDFSSAPGFACGFESDPKKSNAQHINKIIKHNKLGHIIVITSGTRKIEGITNGHAYTILDVFETHGRVLFKIRNPWASFEWNGEYGENSSLWTPELKKLVGYQSGDDGVFFITENELPYAFCYYSISMINPSLTYSYSQFSSQKNQDIFYKLKIPISGSYNIRITQQFARMVNNKNYKYSPMIFQIGKINEDNNTVTYISESVNQSFFGAKSVHAFQAISRQLGSGLYFVRLRMFWVMPELFNTAILGAFGPEALIFEKLSQEQGEKYMKQLFISYCSGTERNQIGNGYYKIVTMKGQFVIIAQTDSNQPQKASFQFTKAQMQLTQLQLGKVSEDRLQVIVRTSQPGVGTASRTCPAKGGTTGPFNIYFEPV